MKVGEVVECIDDKCQLGTGPFVVRGQLYTITGIVNDPIYGIDLHFAELEMGKHDYLFPDRFFRIIDRSSEE